MIEANRFRELVELWERASLNRPAFDADGDKYAEARYQVAEMRLLHFVTSHAAELLALVEASGRTQPWSHELSGAIWSEIRSNLTGRFEEQFTLHQQADRYERSSAHLDECARILAQRIEDKLFPPAPEPTP